MHGELHTNQLSPFSGFYMHVCVCMYVRNTDCVCVRARELMYWLNRKLHNHDTTAIFCAFFFLYTNIIYPRAFNCMEVLI